MYSDGRRQTVANRPEADVGPMTTLARKWSLCLGIAPPDREHLLNRFRHGILP